MRINGNVLCELDNGDVNKGVLIIPTSVNQIGRRSCKNNKDIKYLFIPSSCNTIGAEAFSNCVNLKEVYFYKDAQDLKNIIQSNSVDTAVNNNVSHYGDHAFDFTSLKNFSFGKRTDFVGTDIFPDCMEKVSFKKGSLEHLSVNSLPNSNSLEIDFPDNASFMTSNFNKYRVKKPVCYNFNSFVNLTNFSDHRVETIQDDFYVNFKDMEKFGLKRNETRLKDIYSITNGFYPTAVIRSSEKAEIRENLNPYEKEIFDFKYNTKIMILDDGKLIELKPQELVENFNVKINPDMYQYKMYEYTRTNDVVKMYQFKKMLEKYNSNAKPDFFLLDQLKTLEQIEQYVKTYKNFKLWRMLEKQIENNSNEYTYKNNKKALYNLAFMLGCFCDDEKTKARAIDYIYNSLLNFGNKINNIAILSYVERFEIYENKVGESQFEFLKTYLPQIIKYCNDIMESCFGNYEEIKNYLSYLSENFNELKKSCRNAKVEFNFLNSFKLSNLSRFSKYYNEQTKDIIREISKYPQLDERSLEVVLNAKNTMANEKVSQNVFEPFNNNMLSGLFNEESLKDGIYRNLDNGYCYHWINKYRTLNMTHAIEDRTGCAHLGSMGEGIVVASMVDKDCQNVRIIDKNGKGVARATVYVDREKGTMLYNSFLVYGWTSKKKEELKDILETFKMATAEFIEAYQKNYPESKKITLVNVGKGYNGLQNLLTSCNSSQMLQGKNFNEFKGDSSHYYMGDWQLGQFKFLSFSEIRQSLKRLERLKNKRVITLEDNEQIEK